MSRFCLALVVALSGGFVAPAWAQGYGCCGGFVVSHGCSGGWTSAGCWGRTSAGYGCFGGGCYGSLPVIQSSSYTMGCYGGSPVIQSGSYTMGCYGSSPVFSSGCWGGASAAYGASWYGVPGGWGVPVASEPVRVVEEKTVIQPKEERRPVPPKASPEASTKVQTESLGSPEDAGNGPAPATIVVQLPAQARLTINDKASQLTSTTRKLVTPPLNPGKDYFYTLKAEYPRDGQTVSASQRVAVRAGEVKQIMLGLSAGGSAQ